MLSFPPCRNPRRRTQDSFGLWALKKQWRSRSVLHLLAHLFASLLLTWMPSSGPLQLQVGHRVQVEVQEREEEWARGVVGKEDIEDVEGRAAQGEQAELRMGTEGVPCSRSSEEGMAVRTVREEDIQAEEAIQEALPWDTGPSGVHTAAQESLLGGQGVLEDQEGLVGVEHQEEERQEGEEAGRPLLYSGPFLGFQPLRPRPFPRRRSRTDPFPPWRWAPA
mmetsp:Transcript_44347/g.139926  ORF Transcript_44347/g.139926 Transcript_44347/m.139926 type:complete len:221 (-) Transcript_44347:206-868(-)